VKKRAEEEENSIFSELVFVSSVSESELKKEKFIARQIRATAWWKKKLSNSKCYYCNRNFPPKELTMDHLIPLIRGGKSVKSNLVPACKECNNNKKYFLPTEWQQYLGSLNKQIDE